MPKFNIEFLLNIGATILKTIPWLHCPISSVHQSYVFLQIFVLQAMKKNPLHIKFTLQNVAPLSPLDI